MNKFKKDVNNCIWNFVKFTLLIIGVLFAVMFFVGCDLDVKYDGNPVNVEGDETGKYKIFEGETPDLIENHAVEYYLEYLKDSGEVHFIQVENMDSVYSIEKVEENLFLREWDYPGTLKLDLNNLREMEVEYKYIIDIDSNDAVLL